MTIGTSGSGSGTKRRLGRGLDGLLPAAPTSAGTRQNFEVPIEDLHPNREQPRRNFDDGSLTELADSIREHGVLEPILVRKRAAAAPGFEIIAGERRWRAAQRAGLKDVPVFVRELSDQAAFEAALVENLQREDLNAIETARAFQRLHEDFGLTHEMIAERVGKDRSTVANSLRLLKLPDSVLDRIETGQLSEGHGRAILSANDVATMETLARMAVERGLSVRDVERRAREATGERNRGNAAKPTQEKSANVRDLEQRLSHALGAVVSIEDKKGKGHVSIQYASYDELDRLLQHLL